MSATPLRVLWVTFDFPPRMSSGVYRPIRLLKYLDRSAFQVEFVTHGASRRFHRAVDDATLLSEVSPAPVVHRVPAFIPHDLLPDFARRVRRSLRGLLRRPPQSAGSDGNRAGSPAAPSAREPRPGPYHRLAMWAYFPDHLFLWGWLAALRCLWLHAWRRYDIIYTTSYPESAHIPGLILRLCGVRWVADYRYGGPLWIKKLVGYRKTRDREERDHWFQGLVLRRAHRVVAQSDPIAADFCRTFGLEPARVHVIPNGYDESDYTPYVGAPPPFAKQSSELHLMHVGAMEGTRDLERQQIVDALNRLAGDLQREDRRLVFHAVGADILDGSQYPQRLAFEYRHHGTIVHRDLPPYQLAADAFLLSTITTASGSDAIKGFIPGKLWEYLRARRPVLMVGPKDVVWNILVESGVGVDMGVAGEVRVSAQALIDQVLAAPSQPDPIPSHSWASRARAMEQVFIALQGPQAEGSREAVHG